MSETATGAEKLLRRLAEVLEKPLPLTVKDRDEVRRITRYIESHEPPCSVWVPSDDGSVNYSFIGGEGAYCLTFPAGEGEVAVSFTPREQGPPYPSLFYPMLYQGE